MMIGNRAGAAGVLIGAALGLRVPLGVYDADLVLRVPPGERLLLEALPRSPREREAAAAATFLRSVELERLFFLAATAGDFGATHPFGG